MRIVPVGWLVCLGVALAGVAQAAPRDEVTARLEAARALDDAGEYRKALAEIDAGLALAPGDLRLLGLKPSVLLKLRDHEGVLAAVEAILAAGATGRARRDALKTVKQMMPVRTTSLEITVAGGPVEVYLESTSFEVFCTAAPSCRRGVLPGSYKVIAKRPGYEVWSARVNVAMDTTEKLAITLVEKPSLLTVRVVPADAQVTVDDAPYEAPRPVTAGARRVTVARAGHVTARLDVTAREGKPIDLDVALTQLVPVRLQPASARLVLAGEPVAIEDGRIAIPPGAHVLTASAAGHDERRIEISAERPAGFALEITLSPRAIPPPPASRPDTFGTRRKVAVVGGAVALAAGAAGVVLGLQAGDRDEEARTLCPVPETGCAEAARANELNQQARSRALQANIAYGAAGGAVLVAAVLWFTGAPESRVAVAPRVGGAVTGLDLAVRF